jgi:DNA polymerase-3 subunit delta
LLRIKRVPTLSFEDILKQLKNKDYQPVYFLHGKESYYIDVLTDYISEHVLSEGEKAFNYTVFYGKDASHLALLDTARRYPMMAERQVVILKEAQEMRTLSNLLSYIEKPTSTSLFLICYKHKKFNFNSKFGKALKKAAVVFESKPLYDNQVPDWIVSFLKKKKLIISPKASQLLAEYLGTDLSKIANELEKLAINLPEGAEVTEKAIEDNIGISKDYNVFELQRALGQKDVVKANRIINYFGANPKKMPMPVLISSLYNFFSKLYLYHAAKNLPEKKLLTTLQLRSTYFLKEYRTAARHYPPSAVEKVITLLKEYDLKSKGVGYISTGKAEISLAQELIWKILH